ncbi:RNA methyltransferase [Alloscardovia theropitheci]|uniref:RNA methyltransferase n=1 Tax=Alloscardovia theropitheci TaxID=2496842 RepID=A0A4R0QRC7_9BIFI|nr:RNA methyltransferase [Alloscardovia theropitheci]TCD53585.1 RNA methyltransferase [Alloscardovia theropitheci]
MPMHREIMDNTKASRVRMVSELAQRKTRKKMKRFLVEGPQSVREALLFASESVRDIYVRSDFTQSQVLVDLVNEALDKDIYVHQATSEVIEAISADSQGIVAVVDTSALSHEDSEGSRGFLDALSASTSPEASALIAACWQLRDPGNAGTIIRAADASGCSAVILVGDCVDITNPKVVRSTAGSLFHLPIVSMTEEEFFSSMRNCGGYITAADVYGTEKTPVIELEKALEDNQTQNKKLHAILFGNEARGLTSQLVNSCDRAAVIPLYGNAESLNVAMSASIMLYAFAMRSHREH